MNDLRDDGLWSLFEASAGGDLGAVKRLVEGRPELVRAEYNYTPAIHFAVRQGWLEVARYLIDRGAETANYRSYPLQDSLLTLAEDREDGAMAELLREVAGRRFPVAPGFAAFLDAVKSGDGDAVRVALEKGPGMARGSDDTGDTGLHRAAETGDPEVMAALARDRGEANRADSMWWRPITAAARGHGDGETAAGAWGESKYVAGVERKRGDACAAESGSAGDACAVWGRRRRSRGRLRRLSG